MIYLFILEIDKEDEDLHKRVVLNILEQVLKMKIYHFIQEIDEEEVLHKMVVVLNKDLIPRLREEAARLSPDGVVRSLEKTLEMLGLTRRVINSQLALEVLLLRLGPTMKQLTASTQDKLT